MSSGAVDAIRKMIGVEEERKAEAWRVIADAKDKLVYLRRALDVFERDGSPKKRKRGRSSLEPGEGTLTKHVLDAVRDLSADGRWLQSVEIRERAGTLPQETTSILAILAKRGLIERAYLAPEDAPASKFSRRKYRVPQAAEPAAVAAEPERAPEPEKVPEVRERNQAFRVGPKTARLLAAIESMTEDGSWVTSPELAVATGLKIDEVTAFLAQLAKRGKIRRADLEDGEHPRSKSARVGRKYQRLGSQVPQEPQAAAEEREEPGAAAVEGESAADPWGDEAAVLSAMARIDEWATETEIAEEADNGRPRWWVRGFLKEKREAGEVEYQYGPHPKWPSEQAHLYRLVKGEGDG